MKKKDKFNNFKPSIINSFKLLWHFMTKKQKVIFVFIFLFSFVSALAQTFGALIPALIIARFTGEAVSVLKYINLLSLSVPVYILVICSIEVVLWIIGMLCYRLIDIFARQMMCEVNEKVQEIILLERKNLDFGMTIGETNYIVKNAVDNIYHIIEPFCWQFLVYFISVIYMLIDLFILNALVGGIALILVAIILVCVFVRTKLQQNVVEKIEDTNAKIGNHFLQSLTNLPMITIFESKRRELSELKKLNSKFFKQNKKRANIGFWYWTVVTSLEYLGLAGIVIAYASVCGGTNIVAAVTIIINELIMIYSMVENWGYLTSDLQYASIKFCNLQKIYPQSKITEFVSEEIFAEDSASNDLKEKISTVEVKNLSVKIGSFKKTYDITFNSGNLYVISGQSGQGKTTLVNAICGLRESDAGNIILNGKTKCKSLYDYKSHISYLFQDSVLFDRSIEENIAYPEKELSLKAKEFVKLFGMQKLLLRNTSGSVAKSLSGGEKKRIDIIRTISKDKDIYFLDEPTNELDKKNVERVLKVMKELSEEDKIVIVISHDERCCNIADQVIEL